MKLRRIPYLFSATRLRYCRAHCRSPYRAFFDLSFVRRGTCTIALKNGKTASFARGRRDHKFWDWFFSQHLARVDFTEQGEVQLLTERHTLLFRPGAKDFLFYREIFLDDAYGLRQIRSEIRNVIDLGGNVGLFSCAVLPEARRVITVEPIEANHRQAVRNVALNSGNPDDVLHRAASGTAGRRIQVFLARRSSGVHSISQEWATRGPQGDSVTVESVTLSELLGRFKGEPVDLVKCDIEGAEYDVFLNTSRADLQRIQRIHMEAHVSKEFPFSMLQQLASHLTEAGFAVATDVPLAEESFRDRTTLMLSAFRG